MFFQGDVPANIFDSTRKRQYKGMLEFIPTSDRPILCLMIYDVAELSPFLKAFFDLPRTVEAWKEEIPKQLPDATASISGSNLLTIELPLDEKYPDGHMARVFFIPMEELPWTWNIPAERGVVTGVRSRHSYGEFVMANRSESGIEFREERYGIALRVFIHYDLFRSPIV